MDVAFVQVETVAQPLDVCLREMMTMLHALYMLHRSAHWTVVSDYGDHLLFQRLYEPLDDEIDTLAERMVLTLGPQSVDPQCIAEGVNNAVQTWCCEDPCPYSRGQAAELELLECIERCMTTIRNSGNMTLGWEDFLGGVMSQHEENMYLLTQRLS